MRNRATRQHATVMAGHRRLVLAGGAALTAALALPLALDAMPATASSRQAGATSATTITVKDNATWGRILTLSTGWTVYRLTSDKTDKSTCTGACAKAWPPVMLAKGQKAPDGKGVAHLGSFARKGGRQVTYEGIPLYRYADDKKAGQVNGNIKDAYGQWWTVNPAKPKAVPVKTGGGGGSSRSTTTTVPGGGVSY